MDLTEAREKQGQGGEVLVTSLSRGMSTLMDWTTMEKRTPRQGGDFDRLTDLQQQREGFIHSELYSGDGSPLTCTPRHPCPGQHGFLGDNVIVIKPLEEITGYRQQHGPRPLGGLTLLLERCDQQHLMIVGGRSEGDSIHERMARGRAIEWGRVYKSIQTVIRRLRVLKPVAKRGDGSYLCSTSSLRD